jgi:hypothetical protein
VELSFFNIVIISLIAYIHILITHRENLKILKSRERERERERKRKRKRKRKRERERESFSSLSEKELNKFELVITEERNCAFHNSHAFFETEWILLRNCRLV